MINPKLSDPYYLPSVLELQTAFPLEHSYPTDSKEFAWVCPEFIKLELALHNYQVYTTEFIESLAKYLLKRKLRVLEVGSGDGRLCHFLKQYLPENQVVVIATDNMNWEEAGLTNKSSHVEKLGYQEAIEKYATEPTLILSCWMNNDVNWTADFRANPNIKEYILIGDVFRTAGYGQGWYLPEASGFHCDKLSRSVGDADAVVTGSLGRFMGSPHNLETRSEVYSFKRTS